MSKAGKILSFVIYCIYVMVVTTFILRSGYFQADGLVLIFKFT
jgi:hypothetical protein